MNIESNDLKFTTAGDYIEQQKSTALPYYINESGLKIDRHTGEIWQPVINGQCLPP